MSGRTNTNILVRLRRQRGRLGRFVLATLALASFTIAGAPCFAMAAPAPVAHVDPSAHAEAHGDRQGHEHAVGHGNGALGAHEQSEHPFPKHCPHCPPTAAMSQHAPASEHAFCAAVDDVSDQSSTSPSKFAKSVVLVAAFGTLAPLAFHPPPRPRLREGARARTRVALNLRHCVFLI
jgi:hypothetical protein